MNPKQLRQNCHRAKVINISIKVKKDNKYFNNFVLNVDVPENKFSINIKRKITL